jgi:hypothetical protein
MKLNYVQHSVILMLCITFFAPVCSQQLGRALINIRTVFPPFDWRIVWAIMRLWIAIPRSHHKRSGFLG